jgi:erythromycin esterase-like protein
MSPPSSTKAQIDEIRRVARPLDGSAGAYAPLMDRIGNARFVLLGEASHGTHEFYASAPRSPSG